MDEEPKQLLREIRDLLAANREFQLSMAAEQRAYVRVWKRVIALVLPIMLLAAAFLGWAALGRSP